MNDNDMLVIPEFLQRPYDPQKKLPRVEARRMSPTTKVKRDRRLPPGWQMPKGGIDLAGWELLRRITSGELARSEAQKTAERDARLAALRSHRGQ